MRAFVALPLPAEVTSALTALQGGVPGARWIPQENMHITLAFPGDISSEQEEDVIRTLGEIRLPPFDIFLAGVGHFGSRAKPRVLWVGVEEKGPLSALQGKVTTRMRAAGIDLARRKFRPHVTLARLKDPPRGRVGCWLSQHNLFRFGPVTIDRFALFSSTLSETGATYVPEETFFLP